MGRQLPREFVPGYAGKGPASGAAVARPGSRGIIPCWKEEVAVAAVGNADAQYSPAALSTVHDTGRDVDHAAGAHYVRFSIQRHCPLAVQDVVKFGSLPMIMFLCTVDIDGVHPGRDLVILAADQ